MRNERRAAPPRPAGPSPSVKVSLIRLDDGVPVPRYAHPHDAGVDLTSTAEVVLEPGDRAVVGTGVAIALPPGHAGFVHPRSGLAARAGVSVLNSPGTIDAGYRAVHRGHRATPVPARRRRARLHRRARDPACLTRDRQPQVQRVEPA
jgi:hypothetical protein